MKIAFSNGKYLHQKCLSGEQVQSWHESVSRKLKWYDRVRRVACAKCSVAIGLKRTGEWD